MDVESSVRKAAGGDLDAFAAITRAFQHMAFGYALGFVRDIPEEAFYFTGGMDEVRSPRR